MSATIAAISALVGGTTVVLILDALAARQRRRPASGREVSAGLWALGMLALGLLYALLGPWAVGALLAAGVLVILGRNTIEHRQARILDEQAYELLKILVLRTGEGVPLVRALQDAANRAPEPLQGELTRLMHRLASGELPEVVFFETADDPRYENTHVWRALMRQMGHAASTRSGRAMSPSQVHEWLKMFRTVVDKSRAVQENLETRMAQARYARYTMNIVVFVMTVLILRSRPEFAAHLLYNPVGRATLAVAGGLVLVGNVLAARLSHVKRIEF